MTLSDSLRSHRKTLSKVIVIMGSAALLTSCQGSLTMWVVPGSTATDLVLGWSKGRDGDEKIQPREIRVFPGETIRLQSSGSYYPDARQAPGCYVVIADAGTRHGPTESASMGYKIAPDGTVSDMPPTENENLFR